MILKFDEFINEAYQRVPEHRHLEVLEAAREVINSLNTSENANHLLNFGVLFAQLYGSNCEDYLTMDESIALAKLYNSELYDFSTRSYNNDSIDAMDKIVASVKAILKKGWIVFNRHESNQIMTDGDEHYITHPIEYIFYRQKLLNIKKLNQLNQKTGIFENKKESLNFLDIKAYYDSEAEDKFRKHIVKNLKKKGYKVTYLPWQKANDYVEAFFIYNIPFQFDEHGTIEIKIELLNAYKNTLQETLYDFLEEYVEDGNGMFDSFEQLDEFFERIKLMTKPKLQKAIKIGVLDEAYKIDKDEMSFRDAYSKYKAEVDKHIVNYIADSLRKAGFTVNIDPEMFYNITVNSMPMHVVNNYELAFDNDRVYGLKDRGAVLKKEQPVAGSFAKLNPQVFDILLKNGVDSSIGGPHFKSAYEFITWFNSTNIDFFLKDSVKAVGKTGVWE